MLRWYHTPLAATWPTGSPSLAPLCGQRSTPTTLVGCYAACPSSIPLMEPVCVRASVGSVASPHWSLRDQPRYAVEGRSTVAKPPSSALALRPLRGLRTGLVACAQARPTQPATMWPALAPLSQRYPLRLRAKPGAQRIGLRTRAMFAALSSRGWYSGECMARRASRA